MSTRRPAQKKSPVTKLQVRPPVLAPPPANLKIDLACGANCQQGFDGADLVQLPGVRHVVNLLRYPWPWADNSVLELHCSHFIEHIPMVYVLDDGTPTDDMATGQDALLRFFDECYRVLSPEGSMKVVWPAHRSDRAFQDPTHRRFVPQQFFGYLNKAWLRDSGLLHYKVKCFFTSEGGWSWSTDFNVRADEVKAQMLNHEWNRVLDWHATLKPVKPIPPEFR